MATKSLQAQAGQLSPPFSLYFYDWLTQIQARTGDASTILPLANPYLSIPDLSKAMPRNTAAGNFFPNKLR
jgi:hypothetical protein